MPRASLATQFSGLKGEKSLAFPKVVTNAMPWDTARSCVKSDQVRKGTEVLPWAVLPPPDSMFKPRPQDDHMEIGAWGSSLHLNEVVMMGP